MTRAITEPLGGPLAPAGVALLRAGTVTVSPKFPYAVRAWPRAKEEVLGKGLRKQCAHGRHASFADAVKCAVVEAAKVEPEARRRKCGWHVEIVTPEVVLWRRVVKSRRWVP